MERCRCLQACGRPGVRVNRAVPRHPDGAGPDVWYDQSLVASRMKTTRYFDEQGFRKEGP